MYDENAPKPTNPLNDVVDFGNLSEWEALLKVAEIFLEEDTNRPQETLRYHSVRWLMSRGEKIFWNQEDIDFDKMPYEACVGLINASNWPICEVIIKNMPERYVEKYLVESVASLPGSMQGDHYEALSERTDAWGLPANMLKRVYGK